MGERGVYCHWYNYDTKHQSSVLSAHLRPLSVDLQVGWGGPVSPLVHLVSDGCSTQRTRLLPVEPQSDALVTENMLWRKQTALTAVKQTRSKCFSEWEASVGTGLYWFVLMVVTWQTRLRGSLYSPWHMGQTSPASLHWLRLAAAPVCCGGGTTRLVHIPSSKSRPVFLITQKCQQQQKNTNECYTSPLRNILTVFWKEPHDPYNPKSWMAEEQKRGLEKIRPKLEQGFIPAVAV